MEQLLLEKEKLFDLLREIGSKNELIGPIEENGFLAFKKIENPEDINLDILLSRVPPKSLILQQTETLFTYTKGKDAKVQTPQIDESQRVIFGIRPCDARGYDILDPIFMGRKEGNYADPFYTKRRNRSLLIGLSCNKPNANCF